MPLSSKPHIAPRTATVFRMRHRRQNFLVMLALVTSLTNVWGQSDGTAAPDRNSVTIYDLEATTLDGASFEVSSLKDKVTVLDFWTSWCSPCLKAFPVLKALRAELGGDDFEIVSVTVYSGPAEQVSKVVSRYELDHPVILGDAQSPVKFDVLGYPTYLLMDKEGNLVRRYVGDFNNPLARLRRDAIALLEGKELAVLP